jgi:hypothetical protein
MINIFLYDEAPDILILTEHGLKDLEVKCISFQGYNITAHYSRVKHKSGGVLIITKISLEVDILDFNIFCNELNIETCGIDLKINTYVIRIIGIYRSPSGSKDMFFDTFDKLLLNSLTSKKDLIVVGDFNIPWNIEDNNKHNLRILTSCYLLEQLVDKFTRVYNETQNIIDLVFTNVNKDAIAVEVVGTGLSDHFAQVININVECENEISLNQKILLRNYSRTNINKLSSYLETETWNKVMEASSTDGKFGSFMDIFIKYLDLSCPFKTIINRQRRFKKPWLTVGIVTSSRKLKELDRQKHYKGQEFQTYYKNYKRIYRKVIRLAKSKFVFDKIKGSKNINKDTWSLINNERNKQKNSINVVKLKLNDKMVEDPIVLSEAFNDHYVNVAQRLKNNTDVPSLIIDELSTPTSSLMLFPTDSYEVYDVIHSLNDKSAQDVFGISNKIVRIINIFICEILANIINTSLEEGVFPEVLKTSRVKPIYKSGSTNDINNYRPVSIISPFSKIFEIIYLRRLEVFLNDNGLLSDNQFGFTRGKSTNNAINKVISEIVKGLEMKNKTVGIFMDLSKAFDCVNSEILCNKLHLLGVRGISNNWLKSYLSNRKQVVDISGYRSKSKAINFGVPQGSILGPILYNIYINSLTKEIKYNKITCYADDIVMTVNQDTIQNLEISSYILLTQIYQFMGNINLFVNCKKTNFMNFNIFRSNDEQFTGQIVMDNVELSETKTVKYLGILIDANLKWHSHINSICNSLTSCIFCLSYYVKFKYKPLLKVYYHAIIESKIRYGIIIWGSASQRLMKRIFVIQKKAIRLIQGIRKRTSCRQAFKNLKILPLYSLYIFEIIIFAKFHVNYKDSGAVKQYNTRGAKNLRQENHRLSINYKLPQHIGASFFNKLPYKIKKIEDKNKFKKELKSFLIDNSFYSVDEFNEFYYNQKRGKKKEEEEEEVLN